MANFATVAMPAEGVWRVGWALNPVDPPQPRPLDLADTRAGNRYDSVTAAFVTRYAGTTEAACFAETLAHRRPDPRLLKLLENDPWDPGHMGPGKLEQMWRLRRSKVRILANPNRARFLDIANYESIAWLNDETMAILLSLGQHPITLSTVTSGDRSITRHLSSWLYEQMDDDGTRYFDGIRYPSQYGIGLENWAIYPHVSLQGLEERSIELHDPALMQIADLFHLQVF